MRGSGVDYDASNKVILGRSGGADSERNRKEDFSLLYEARREAKERCGSRDVDESRSRKARRRRIAYEQDYGRSRTKDETYLLSPSEEKMPRFRRLIVRFR